MSGVTPPSAPDFEMTSPLTVATSDAVALGSQCGAWGPSRTTMHPCDSPSATENPWQLKVFAARLRFRRNCPPARGVRYRYKCPANARRTWKLAPPILVGGIIVGSIFVKGEFGIQDTWILIGFLKMVAFVSTPAVAPPWGGWAALYFRCFGASGPCCVPVSSHRLDTAFERTPPVGFEPWTSRPEVRTSSAAANPPPIVLRGSVPLKDHRLRPVAFGVGLAVVSFFSFCWCVGGFVIPPSAPGVGFAVISFFFVCCFVGGFVNFLRA